MDKYQKIIVLLGVLFFGQSCTSNESASKVENELVQNQDEPIRVYTDLTKAGLKGKVQYLEEVIYSKAIDVLKEAPENLTISAYTVDGRLDSSVTFVSSSGEKTKVSFYYEYLENSVKITQQVNDQASNFEIGQTLDDKGRVLKIAQYFGGEAAFTEVYKNNASGQWLEKNYETPANYPRPGDMPCKETRQYDDKGYLVQEDIYLNMGKDCVPSKRIDYRNNNQGDPTQLIFKGAKGDTIDVRNWSYKYDEYGNWIERTAYTSTNDPLNRTVRVIRYW
ncbi:MAG: hypothetical protein MK212_21640 [Saprospiraceae bacterium]|nr:hypothetical protein [Saprospiraceae bacterium]